MMLSVKISVHVVFREACKLGCEGIVSKQARSGLTALGEGQKSKRTSGEAGGGGGLEINPPASR
jgi:hypothetical protein